MTYKSFYGDILEIAAEQQQRNEANEVSHFYGLDTDVYDLKEFQERVQVKEDVPTIRKIIEDNSELYAGVYYESEKGMLVVQITEDSKAVRDKISENIKYNNKIQFQVVNHSRAKLEEAKRSIRELAPAGLVQALIPDVVNNKLIVSLSDMQEVNTSKINNLFSDSSFIEFIPPAEINLMSDETTYGDPYPMGSRISKYINRNGIQSRILCTSSYIGIDVSDQDVLVTAGHCDNVGSNSLWYQSNNQSTSIGKWSFRTSSSDPQGADKTSDAGYISMSGKDAMPYIPYPNGDMTPITGVYVSDLVGDTVYMRGATVGALVSGKIKYEGVDVWYGQEGYGYVRGLVFADYSNQQGCVLQVENA